MAGIRVSVQIVCLFVLIMVSSSSGQEPGTKPTTTRESTNDTVVIATEELTTSEAVTPTVPNIITNATDPTTTPATTTPATTTTIATTTTANTTRTTTTSIATNGTTVTTVSTEMNKLTSSTSPDSNDTATVGRTGTSRPSRTTEPVPPPGTTEASNNDSSLVGIIIGVVVAVVVVVIVVTIICICCIGSRRKRKDPLPSSNGGFEPTEVRTSKDITGDRGGTTMTYVSEHNARLSEADTLPSSDPLKTRNANQIYSKEIHQDGRGSRSPHGFDESSGSIERNGNGLVSRERPGSNNIFDKIDPTTAEEPDELELSPTMSPSSSGESDHDVSMREPMPVARRPISNPANIIKRPTPQPRPRTTLPTGEASDESGNADSSTTSPKSPRDNRPFRKGKGPDGSDQAALLANVLRKTPRPISQADPDNESGTKYW